jgi:hypothetical protein
MKSIRIVAQRAVFALAITGAIGFGATQAFAAPFRGPGTDLVSACEDCARQCVTIKLCQPGYCECA